MILERRMGETCVRPFPVHENLVASLLGAHTSTGHERDPVVATVLATCSGYAYGDTETMSLMMSRLGLERHACVRIAMDVAAMFVSSSAYLVQSSCGRVVILCYRGTEATNLGNWLADVDVGSDTMVVGDERFPVHSGFYRNVRASRWDVINELNLALEGKSLADPQARVEHPMEALYVTGHSLGGAMGLLLALSMLAGHDAIAERLRAVYTFGQPLAIGEPLPAIARDLAPRVFRHVMARDPIPGLPARTWGALVHLGREYRHTGGKWRRAETPVAQMKNMRAVPRSVLALFGAAGPGSPRYTLAAHGPHHYMSALRQEGRITEFGDRG